MCPRPILPAIEEGTLEKGQLLVFPDPGSWTAPPFVPADAASKEVTRGREPQLLEKMAGRFRWDAELSWPRSPHLRVLRCFPGLKAGPKRATGSLRPCRVTSSDGWFLPEPGALPDSASGQPAPGKFAALSPATAAPQDAWPAPPPGTLPREEEKGIPHPYPNLPCMTRHPLSPLGGSSVGPGSPDLSFFKDLTHCDTF